MLRIRQHYQSSYSVEPSDKRCGDYRNRYLLTTDQRGFHAKGEGEQDVYKESVLCTYLYAVGRRQVVARDPTVTMLGISDWIDSE